MDTKVVLLVFAVVCTVQCLPLVQENEFSEMTNRFINPSLTMGDFSRSFIEKMRVKRSYEEDCEKLQLCKLHARSQTNFFAAFELYFVNKENARLWDHQNHSVGDCERRYACYG